ncbi:trehalose-phosphatase [Ranunculus cassubicifolius]
MRQLHRQGISQIDMEAISKAKHDENDEQICISRTPNYSSIGCSSTDKNNKSDASYTSWLKKHPSAIRMFDQMMAVAKGKRIVVFLDYDGTLSPIVEDPNLAFMSDTMRSAVREVARYIPTAIISGRSREKVYEFVHLTSVYYAGSHGMDIMGPVRPLTTSDVQNQTRLVDQQGNQGVLFQPAKEFLPVIQEILTVLEEKTKNIPGVLIENNRFCISVHFRRVHEEDYVRLEEQVKSILKEYPNFHSTRGRKVIEIRPSIKWDKGHAVEYLLETFGFGNNSNVIPLYIGDDRTDEDAFRVLRNKKQSYPIIVSSVPKETKALFSLRDPSEVMCFLMRLARWRRNSSSSRLTI